MTVTQFLTLTASTPTPVLRKAMTAALAVEPADGPEAYSRFYCRVLDDLGLLPRPGFGASETRRTGLAAAGPQARRDPAAIGPDRRRRDGSSLRTRQV